MLQCVTCGRNFLPQAFKKHVNLCKSVFTTKRKLFDSKKTRMICSHHAMILRTKEKMNEKNEENNTLDKKNESIIPKWKLDSDKLRLELKSTLVKGSEFNYVFISRKKIEKKYIESPIERSLISV